MTEVVNEFMVPFLRAYKRKHGSYPPPERRFLDKVLTRMPGITNEQWRIILTLTADEILRLEQEEP